MASSRNFHRMKFKCRINRHRMKLKCRINSRRKNAITTFLSLIIFFLSMILYEEHFIPHNSQVNLNTLRENAFSNTLLSFPHVPNNIIQRTTSAQTIENEPLPELEFEFALTDEKCNRKLIESFNNEQTLTKFSQKGNCSHISVTAPFAYHAYKDADIIRKNDSVIYSDSNCLKSLPQYKNQPQEIKMYFLYEKRFSIDYGVHYHSRIGNRIYSQALFTKFLMINSNANNTYLDIFKHKKLNDHQIVLSCNYVTQRIFQTKDMESKIAKFKENCFGHGSHIDDSKLRHIKLNAAKSPKDMESTIAKFEEKHFGHGSHIDHSKLHQIKLNSAKSPGNVIQPSGFIMALSIFIMYSSATTSSASSSIVPDAAIMSDEDINKLRIIHTLNSIGQTVLLKVYQLLKPFDNSKSIKEHIMNDLHWPEYKFKDDFNATMISIIDSTPESGDDYDISLLAKCLRVLSKSYEPHSQWKWKDENELECRCQKLVDTRNQEFHSFSGIKIPELRSKMDSIQKLLMDILISLEVRFPSKSSEINDMKKEIDDKISYILTHPLGRSEIRTCLLQKYLKIFRDEIPFFKDRCKEWGKFKILDFLLGCGTFHNVKILFTEVVVKKSNQKKQNAHIKCTDILKLASPTSILLIDSETGGGKTTIFRFGINDWGEGGDIMNTKDFDYIFPMVFRNPHISSVNDLLGGLIPNVTKKIAMKDLMECIADPSLKILFFCDGFDEKNEKSLKVFREICDLKEKYHHIRVIVTSRPESVREFYYTVGTDHSIEHLQVLGIHESKRGDFLKKYHDELIIAGLSDQTSEDLLHFYESCSSHHKDLYRLPINLVILAWLWGQNPEMAQTIKSAAGLYTAIVDILNNKLLKRLLQSHSDVLNRLKGDIDKLKELIETFKEKIYNESLVAVRFDRIFIDDVGVRNLRDFCEDKQLPFLELKGSYLLSKIEWDNVNNLLEILELPHKGFLDYYAAKCIEYRLKKISKGNRNMVNRYAINSRENENNANSNWENSNSENSNSENSKKENIIKKIILEDYGDDYKNLNLQKYQNILQLLGGILALDDSNLIAEYGQDIIDLLIETGIRNNSQWYNIYSDFNLNATSGQQIGTLIAPHLNLNHFTITDANVDVLCTLIQYVDIDTVPLQIASTTMPAHLPDLIKVLRDKKCHIHIHNIGDDQVDLWNSSITQKAQIYIDNVIIKEKESNLSFLSYCHTLNECYLQLPWRNLHNPAPNMSGWTVIKLRTAVSNIEAIPTTVEVLGLGLLVDPDTGVAQDPGLAHLERHCPKLEYLAVHVLAGTVIKDLPHLPDVMWINSKRNLRPGTNLFLSQLRDEHLDWAVTAASTLQPPGGYQYIVLPSNGFQIEQLHKFVDQLAAAHVVVSGGVEISSQNSNQTEWDKLYKKIQTTLHCRLSWWKDDDDLSCSTGW